MSHARRMAESTTLPILDRRAPSGGVIEVSGFVIPKSGDAELTVDGRIIHLTNLDRVLFPQTGFTKAELVAYYLGVAGKLLPHVRDLPITVGRWPGGIDGRGFAQSEVPGRPEWIRAAPIPLVKGEVKRFTLLDERAALVWLAQMGTIELHPFLGRHDSLSTPTAIVFDLDPGPLCSIADAARVAFVVRDALARRGLASRVKTSGASGIHLLSPLDRAMTYAETRAVAAEVAREVVATDPERITDRMPRAERASKVLIDVRQNSERLSTVAAYSVRATDRPSVSTPITFDELATGELSFSPDDVLRRPDPWS